MAARVGDIEIVSLSDGEGVFPFGFDGVFPEVTVAGAPRWLPLA